MSIELTTAEQALLNRIGATLSPPVLSELPEADASKAGELFYLNGTLWTYSKAGQFGTLAEGEPWPVKGYKEALISFYESLGNIVLDIKTNDFLREITVTKPVQAGRYHIEDSEFDIDTQVIVSQGSIEESIVYFANADNNTFATNGIVFSVLALTGTSPQPAIVSGEYQKLTARILKYPPTT